MTGPNRPLDSIPTLDQGMTDRIFSSETMVALLKLVFPFLENHQRALVYVLPASGRFAHMALEPWALSNLFGTKYDRIVVVIHHRDRLPFSFGMHQVSSEVVTFVETDHELIPMMGHYDGESSEVGSLRIHLRSAPNLLRDLWRHVHGGNKLRYLKLPLALEDSAKEFLTRVGLAPTDRFVTVHMRESSYLTTHRYHDFRNMTPDNYKPAIRYLLDQGIHVVRLGDTGSTALAIDHPGFIDLPFREDYADFMDVALLAKAWFSICCSSGPLGPAIAFGTPVLMVNGILEQQTFFNPRDLIQFKRYIDQAIGRPIAYTELLDRGICAFTEAQQFEERHIQLEENSADEILAAVREMQARLEGIFVPVAELDDEFQRINSEFLYRLQSGEDGPAQFPALEPAFGLALPWTRVSQAFCRSNPWFLGGLG